MFAPGSGGQAASSLRSSRRRQRTSLEDSVKPPAAKRQRSSLRREPKQPAADKNIPPAREYGNQPSAVTRDYGVETGPLQERTLAIRSSEKTSKATSQTDHAVILVRLSLLSIDHDFMLTILIVFQRLLYRYTTSIWVRSTWRDNFW